MGWLILAIVVVGFWLFMLVMHFNGLRKVPRLPIVREPLVDEPLVSVIIAAKEEEAAIARTMRGILAQEYRNFELIVVNDRSEDATGERAEEVKREMVARGCEIPIEVVHIRELPSGWLGKNHAIYQGYLRAKGDRLLFTDADVEYQPFALRSAVQFFQELQLDHLTVTPFMEAHGFWLRGFVHFFLFALCILKWPWVPNNDKQHKEGMGIGAFNFLSRAAYEKIGTHRVIAMRPDDDLQLGTKIKQARLKQRFVTGPEHLAVEWYPSLPAAVKGLEKNLFAGLNYSFFMFVYAVIGQFVFFCFPFFAVWLYGGWVSALYFVAVLAMIAIYLLYVRSMSKDKGWEVFTLPFLVLLFLFILIRSTYLTYKQGGIYWRGTFYSLRELKDMQRSDGRA